MATEAESVCINVFDPDGSRHFELKWAFIGLGSPSKKMVICSLNDLFLHSLDFMIIKHAQSPGIQNAAMKSAGIQNAAMENAGIENAAMESTGIENTAM